ncbi:MAG: hypothetical protein RJA36_1150, partial [Pseudomonadota bacterium]
GLRQIDAADADLGKSQVARPAAQLLQLQQRERFMTLQNHPEILGSRLIHWPAEADTEASARRLAATPALRDAFIELHGPLGAGKTTFVRHLLRALGVAGRIKSPSYAVLEPHEARGLAISHFDFYRFEDPREWEDAGFRDVFAEAGLKLVEWPEKARGLMPAPDLSLELLVREDDSRLVTLRAHSAIGLQLLEALAP